MERDVWAFLRWDFKHVKTNDLMMEQATVVHSILIIAEVL